MIPINWWYPVFIRMSPLMIFPMILLALVRKLKPDKSTLLTAVLTGFFFSGINMVNEVAAQLADVGDYIGGLQFGGVAVEVVPIFVLWGAIFCIGLGYLLKRGHRKRVILSYILLFTTLSFIGDFRLVTSNSISFKIYNWDYVWLVWFILISASSSFFIWLSRKRISERFLMRA